MVFFRIFHFPRIFRIINFLIEKTILCLQNFVYKKVLLVRNHIIHPFLVVNSFRYLLELLSNEQKKRLNKIIILLVLITRNFFTFSECEKCIKKTFFVLLSFEGSFFIFISARENRTFLISMLLQSCTSIRKKIRKIRIILIIIF